jgi:hypothetical protein
MRDSIERCTTSPSRRTLGSKVPIRAGRGGLLTTVHGLRTICRAIVGEVVYLGFVIGNVLLMLAYALSRYSANAACYCATAPASLLYPPGKWIEWAYWTMGKGRRSATRSSARRSWG